MSNISGRMNKVQNISAAELVTQYMGRAVGFVQSMDLLSVDHKAIKAFMQLKFVSKSLEKRVIETIKEQKWGVGDDMDSHVWIRMVKGVYHPFACAATKIWNITNPGNQADFWKDPLSMVDKKFSFNTSVSEEQFSTKINLDIQNFLSLSNGNLLPRFLNNLLYGVIENRVAACIDSVGLKAFAKYLFILIEHCVVQDLKSDEANTSVALCLFIFKKLKLISICNIVIGTKNCLPAIQTRLKELTDKLISVMASHNDRKSEEYKSLYKLYTVASEFDRELMLAIYASHQ